MKTNPSLSRQGSLRFFYILIVILVVSIMVGGAISASLYVNKVTRDNAQVLQLQNRVTDEIAELRGAIWLADNALHDLLMSTQSEHHRAIRENLERASASLEKLKQNMAMASPWLDGRMRGFEENFERLKDDILTLVALRQDPEWLYPMLPFISRTLLESNEEFILAANLALNEIEAEEGKSAGPLYRAFDEVRDLWQELILNFRAIIIRFAGLNAVQEISQEENIRIIHAQIMNKLDGLTRLREQGRLGFETEAALETMQFRAEKWYRDYQDLKNLRQTHIWRADLEYLNARIRPRQARVFADLNVLERELVAWSSRNATEVEEAATKINLGLWTLSAVAIGLLLLIYYLLHRLVLSPLERIAETISAEGRNIEDLSLPGRGSREVHTLIQAFNSLRRQIHQRQIALQHQALSDALTGLPNRALLQDRLEQAVHLAHRQNTCLAVLLLDLDRFKEINDTLGHPTGDTVLQQVASRLLECIGEADTVARLGGDEFAIIVPDTDTEQIARFVECINLAIDRKLEVESHTLYVSASIGVALFPRHGTDPMTLIRHADVAMYAAKRNKAPYVLYETSLDEQTFDNLSLLGDLRAELESAAGQLQLWYQPQLRLGDRSVTGVEALLRWAHPAQGFVSPERVVGLAEKSGLITELTRWVLEHAIADCAAWQSDHPDLKVSVNLSAMNLQDPDLPATVRELITRHDLEPDQLALEITESAVMGDPVHAREVLQVLSLMGLELVIDDYGTGFSSLAYLKLLPVSSLKIDKSFVIEMQEDENDAIIVRSTIDLAHNLGLSVIAEGVENSQAERMLHQQRCDAAQGFHFARPMPKPDFLNWMKSRRALAVT